MYNVMKIGGKDYMLEYSIEASLYSECIENLIDFFKNTASNENLNELTRGLSDKERKDIALESIQNSIKGISNIANVALKSFYAGLMKHHGRRGDRTVLSIDDAMDLMEEYFSDHKEDGTDNPYDLLSLCMKQMDEDGFFKKTGLEKLMTQIQEHPVKQNRATRRAKEKVTESK